MTSSDERAIAKIREHGAQQALRKALMDNLDEISHLARQAQANNFVEYAQCVPRIDSLRSRCNAIHAAIEFRE